MTLAVLPVTLAAGLLLYWRLLANTSDAMIAMDDPAASARQRLLLTHCGE